MRAIQLDCRNRKNWTGTVLVIVTPMIGTPLVTTVQLLEVKSVVASKTKPVADAGQKRTDCFPAGAMFNVGGGSTVAGETAI